MRIDMNVDQYEINILFVLLMKWRLNTDIFDEISLRK